MSLTDLLSRPRDMHVLYHRTCGHVVFASQRRTLVEAQRAELVGFGYHSFRIRRVPFDEGVAASKEGTFGCQICQVVPAKAAT